MLDISTPFPEEAGTLTAEEAFQLSESPEFLGKPTHCFSFVRQTAAVKLGLKYWRLSPEDLYTLKSPPIPGVSDEPTEIQMYDDFARDVAIVLWLCHQPDSVCQRARRKPDDYESKIDAFADSQQITINGANFEEASGFFAQSINCIKASIGTPEIQPGSGTGIPKI